MLKREVKTTKDGSKTLFIPEWNENYHSHHGAVQEALHVFIKNGLQAISSSQIKILEIGFGTGLNALLTLNEVLKSDKTIYYEAIEKFPLSIEEMDSLAYSDLENAEHNTFLQLHEASWEKPVEIVKNFKLCKRQLDLKAFNSSLRFDLIYFDAFGPRVQPKMWEKKIFQALFEQMNPNGILVTYCAKGQVRRDLESVGFKVERLPGPPGKREMLRAVKVN